MRVVILPALFVLTVLAPSVGAVAIVAPKDGDVVPIGAELVIQVQPSPGDDIDRASVAHSDEPISTTTRPVISSSGSSCAATPGADRDRSLEQKQ